MYRTIGVWSVESITHDGRDLIATTTALAPAK
jgi:hypothetical protein